MSTNESELDLSQAIGTQLPYLRRHARALTGTQQDGDGFAAKTLEHILHDPSAFDRDIPAKQALFKAFHTIWDPSTAAGTQAESSLEAAAVRHMSKLAPRSREALLLSVIEEFTTEQIADILNVDPDAASGLLDQAYEDMQSSLLGRIMIIEDEVIIAIDLEGIVDDLGHSVTGVARTRDEAVKLAAKDRPDMILSDIQLADNSSGIDAVSDILEDAGDIPVIFITAFPERLLTGERHEPAFLIPKPYTEEQVRVAISQAMFFLSTETLKA